MSEPQPGPGWWQASDDQWYPPEQHPDPAHRSQFAPPGAATTPDPARAAAADAGAGWVDAGDRPPATDVGASSAPDRAGVLGRELEEGGERGRTARRVLLGVLAVLVLGAVGVGAFLLAGGGDDDDPPTESAVPSDTVGDDATSTTDDPEDAAPEEVLVQERLALTFPSDWAVTTPGDGPSAQDLFPDDAASAAVFDQNVTEQGPGALLFAAARPSFDGGVLTSVVASFVAYGEGAGFDSVAAAARPSLESAGGIVEREEDIVLGDADALRVNYSVDTAGRGFTGLQVVVDAGDGAYVLTFQTAADGADAPVIDQVVATIAVR